MPKLITRDALSRSTGESRSIVQAPGNPIGRALRSFSGAVDTAGDAVYKVAEDQKQKDQALDLTKARSALQVSLMQERDKYRFDKDQDQDTWTQRFADNAKVIHENVGDLIRDPDLKARFMADTTPEIARYGQEIDNSATDIRQKRRVTESDTAIDQALESAAGSDASPQAQDAIIQDASASIRDLVKSGVYTPEMGAARTIKFTRDFANRRALADAQADPAKTLRWLQGGKEGTAEESSDELIRRKESFIPTPRMDGKTLRIGYGSDTITTADGKKLKVVPGMRITRADAERDLARRRQETQEGIVGKIGTDAWSKLSTGAKAALTSMAYNYGSLPDSVASAAKSGDPSALANAVRARAPDKGNGVPGLNAQRRFEEAAMIESGKAGGDRPAYYDFLSTEAKLALTKSAETDVAQQDQQIAQQARQAEADATAQQAQRKGEIELGIEQGQVSRESILNDPGIDEGDKALLINKWEAHEKEAISAAQVWDALQKGDPLPANSGDGLDALFKNVGGPPALAKNDPKAVATMGYFWDKDALPPSAKSTLTGMVKSGNQRSVISGLAMLDTLQRKNPVAFDREFDAATSKAVSFYQNRVGYGSESDLFEGLKAMSDPATIKAREPMIEKGRREAEKTYDADKIAGMFGNFLPFSSPGTPQAVGPVKGLPSGTILDSALLERDYHQAYAEAYADDPAHAEQNALRAISRVWGVSEINGGNLMRHPPDRYLRPVDGSFEWATEALEKDLKGLGYVTETPSGVTGLKGPDMVKTYTIQEIPATESDVSAGRNPRYAIIVYSPKTGQWDAVLDKDHKLLAYQWDREEASERSRRSFQARHKHQVELQNMNEQKIMDQATDFQKSVIDGGQ